MSSRCCERAWEEDVWLVCATTRRESVVLKAVQPIIHLIRSQPSTLLCSAIPAAQRDRHELPMIQCLSRVDESSMSGDNLSSRYSKGCGHASGSSWQPSAATKTYLVRVLWGCAAMMTKLALRSRSMQPRASTRPLSGDLLVGGQPDPHSSSEPFPSTTDDSKDDEAARARSSCVLWPSNTSWTSSMRSLAPRLRQLRSRSRRPTAPRRRAASARGRNHRALRLRRRQLNSQLAKRDLSSTLFCTPRFRPRRSRRQDCRMNELRPTLKMLRIIMTHSTTIMHFRKPLKTLLIPSHLARM